MRIVRQLLGRKCKIINSRRLVSRCRAEEVRVYRVDINGCNCLSQLCISRAKLRVGKKKEKKLAPPCPRIYPKIELRGTLYTYKRLALEKMTRGSKGA